MAKKPPASSGFGGGLAGALIKNQKKKRTPVDPKYAGDPLAGKPTTGPPVAPPPDMDAQADAEADRIITEMLAELGYARDAARRQAEQSAQQEINRAKALSQALQALNMPGIIQGVYQNSGQSLAGLAQGFSGSLEGLANAQAAEQANMVAGTGQEGAVRNEGAAMGDVNYGLHGFIPARGLEQTGAAFAAQAALEPGFALQFGNMKASDVMSDYVKNVLPQFTDDEAMIRGKKSGLVLDAKERKKAEQDAKKAEALQLYEAGLISKRELARRLGVPGWKKFSDTVGTPAERPKASASLSKAAGYLVDEYGDPILNAKGGVIRLPKDSERPWGSSTTGVWMPDGQGGWVQVVPPGNQTKTVGGYIYEKDPKTGKWVPVAGTGSTPKGYQLKTRKDGSLVLFDPNTGTSTTIAGPTKADKKKSSQLTPQQRNEARAAANSLAEAAYNGYTDEDGNVFPPLTLTEAIEELKKEPIPWRMGLGILLNYYRSRGPNPAWNPNAKGPVPKGRPGSAGGPNTSGTGSLYVPGGSVSLKKNYKNDTRGLAELWVKAGGDPAVASIAAAIALAESGGRVNAWNPNGRDKSAGLWQINYHGSLRAPRTRQFGPPELLRKDPLANARAAVAIYKSAGNSFNPWTTFTSGKYKKHLKTTPAPNSSQNVSYSGGGKVGTVINFAHQQLGKPYLWGSGPGYDTFDCSDLVQAAYKQIGINIPRVTHDQIKVGRSVKWGQFQPGDLIFTNKGGHVMLYIGNGKMISAPYTGSTVKIVDVSGYKDSFYAARRILSDTDDNPFSGGSQYV